MGQSGTRHLDLRCLDRTFWVLQWHHWDQIINETRLEEARYVTDRRDCENYAMAFSGLASLRYGVNTAGFVVDTSAKHAYNLIVGLSGEELEARVFEPQSDKWVTLGQKGYEAIDGIVAFG